MHGRIRPASGVGGRGAVQILQKNRLFVDYDGTVVPCCIHPCKSLGNLKTTRCSEILRGEARRKLLHDLRTERSSLPICGKCEIRGRPEPIQTGVEFGASLVWVTAGKSFAYRGGGGLSLARKSATAVTARNTKIMRMLTLSLRPVARPKTRSKSDQPEFRRIALRVAEITCSGWAHPTAALEFRL